VGFSVHTEEAGTALDFLGGMASVAGGSSSKDTDILYRFIQSQEIVSAIDARLDLRALWAKGDPDRDPIFAYHPPGTIEDLHGHWLRMVAVYNDTSTGLLDIQVQAFTPEDAQALAQAIYAESQTLINRLSDIAQEDRTRHAREELESAEQRLTEARLEMTRFRNETQIVDPVTALQGQMGLLGALEEQLAQTQIELDLLRESAGDEDPRIDPLVSRVAAIEARMEEERQKLGLGTAAGATGGGTAFADLVGEFERLAVEQEFAQQAYVASLAAYDQALAEGRQQSRYLAAHVAPTLAERAEYPNRWALTLLTALFAFLAWMLLTLTAYALRDRR
jgi:capsular polysaccharide transport system permease protein